MYLYQTVTENIVEEACENPIGPRFMPDVAKKAAKMEIWASSFEDPGPDFYEYRLFDADGTQIAQRHKNGY